jgi:Mn2+/Fe2+ NRAMP family transporter
MTELAGESGAAVLGEAHSGDIEGALGTVRSGDSRQRRTFRRRLGTFLAIMGPGIIVMVGDNDAGGVATYAQAGQNYGYSLPWVLLLLIPVLLVNQEMVVRLGAVTGVGHARLINERFGRFWGWFSFSDLLVLNFLTITTEFIGVSLAFSYFGVSRYVAVPVAALTLIGITTTGSFRRWERSMLLFIVASLILFPLAFLSHPAYSASLYHLAVPGIQGGVNSTAILLIIAIVGTTVAPWQLFFQQSNVIDKRITPRFINHERADTFIGSLVVVIGAGAIMIAGAYAVKGTHLVGHFTDTLGVADALGRKWPLLGAAFAVVLLDASIIGAAAVTLATSYAFGDFFGLRHSLHRSFRDARPFYVHPARGRVHQHPVERLPGPDPVLRGVRAGNQHSRHRWRSATRGLSSGQAEIALRQALTYTLATSTGGRSVVNGGGTISWPRVRERRDAVAAGVTRRADPGSQFVGRCLVMRLLVRGRKRKLYQRRQIIGAFDDSELCLLGYGVHPQSGNQAGRHVPGSEWPAVGVPERQGREQLGLVPGQSRPAG